MYLSTTWENIISKEKHIIFLHQNKFKYFIYFFPFILYNLTLFLFFSIEENVMYVAVYKVCIP